MKILCITQHGNFPSSTQGHEAVAVAFTTARSAIKALEGWADRIVITNPMYACAISNENMPKVVCCDGIKV
jgi:hypothetical protein